MSAEAREVVASRPQMAHPCNFKHITELRSTQHLDDVGACVVLATPSMLQARACHIPSMTG